MKCFVLLSVIAFGSIASAALPTPFFECINQFVGTPMNVTDMRELIKVTPVTYCANQPTAFNKNEMKDLLQQGGNFQLAVSLSNTTYTVAELREMALSRSYTVYVDSGRLTFSDLQSLSTANVRLVVMSASSGLTKAQILTLASGRNLVLNVDSPIQQTELMDYLRASVHLVIRNSVANLNRPDLVALSTFQPNLVTIVP